MPSVPPPRRALDPLAAEITECRTCPRLVEWRERTAREKRAAFRDDDYWGKPVPGFGDPRARILLLGLAPAAHGANRTGRIFTGDRSGDFLFAALHRVGLANRPESVRIGDGLRLRDTWVTAAVRCAPPANAPTPAERDACRSFLIRELAALTRLRVVVPLGGFAYQAAWAGLRAQADPAIGLPVRRPRFGHGVEIECGRITIVTAFHPSQQNTFTGRLTPAMLDAVLSRARDLAAVRPQPSSAIVSPTA
ncbi:MAG: uracil-DNA glycosylase [Actinomycetota bacterium]